MKMRKPPRIHPVQRAIIRQKWSAEGVKAQIHALMGQYKDKLLAYGSILFFVASACAMHLGWTGDEPDMRIVRSSVNALDDLAKRPSITDIDRMAIHSGMLASVRIIEVTPPEVVDEAAWLYAKHSAEWKGKP